MIVYDAFGNPISLGAEIARGEHAILYQVQGQRTQVAKLYHSYRPEYEEKLRWMMAHPPAAPGVTWPQSLLYSARARFVGFLMPRVHPALPLPALWQPGETSGAVTRKALHQEAQRLAKTVEVLHAQGYVLGTLSPSEGLATPAGIMLIDVDAYQVRIPQLVGSVLYPAQLGDPEYTPPERQGQREPTELTPAQDRFALAVLIFQLLMEGYHPFAGWWGKKGPSAPLVERIARGWYPHTRFPSQPLQPLPEMLPLDILHPGLVALFQRCFVEGHAEPLLRPSGSEWAEALAVAQQALVCCEQGHYYNNHLRTQFRTCPECQRSETAAVKGMPSPAFHASAISPTLQQAPVNNAVPASGSPDQLWMMPGGVLIFISLLALALFVVMPLAGVLELITRPSSYPQIRPEGAPSPELIRGTAWLDRTFGSDGLVRTELGWSAIARVLLLQPDGNVVAAGDANDDFALVRYLPDGSLDATFGEGGRVVTDSGGGALRAATLQPDGKIVVAGQVGRHFALARYNRDGSLDAGFGEGGMVITPFEGYSSEAVALVVQPDNRVVAVGIRRTAQRSLGDGVLVRYEADGTLDHRFGTDGRIIVEVEEGQNAASSLLLQPDGKLVVGGTLFLTTQNDKFLPRYRPVAFLSRYHADGTPDDSFFFGSKNYGTYWGATRSQVLDLLLQPDGKMLLAGETRSGIGVGEASELLVRYEDWRVDSTFADDRPPAIPELSLVASNVALQPDGKIVVAATLEIGAQYFIVFRHLTNGELDPDFGDEGAVVLPISGGNGYDLVVQPDGAILVAGQAEGEFALIRLREP